METGAVAEGAPMVLVAVAVAIAVAVAVAVAAAAAVLMDVANAEGREMVLWMMVVVMAIFRIQICCLNA